MKSPQSCIVCRRTVRSSGAMTLHLQGHDGTHRRVLICCLLCRQVIRGSAAMVTHLQAHDGTHKLKGISLGPQSEESNQKRRETIARRSFEEWEKITRKHKVTVTNQTLEYREDIKRRTRETKANQTPEYREEWIRKGRESRDRTFQQYGFPSTSPRQKLVYDLTRKAFPDVVLNLQVEVGGNSSHLYPDVTIPSLMIAIEYDGERYHPDPDIEKSTRREATECRLGRLSR